MFHWASSLIEKKDEFEEREELYRRIKLKPTPKENQIMALANWLLMVLYEPTEWGFVCNREIAKKYGLDKDAINWGDLGVRDVEKVEGQERWIIYVEEASPDADGLRLYLEKYLRAWGWDVEVILEW